MKMDNTILFVNRLNKNCGVIDYGIRLFNIVKKSTNFNIVYLPVENSEDVVNGIKLYQPNIVIYNYYPSVLPFITDDLLSDFRNIPHVGILHEIGLYFTSNGILTVDSTYDDSIDGIFSLPRPLFEDIDITVEKNEIPTIGSFGFGFRDKNFPKIAEMVCNEFDIAKLRLNIPFATFGDHDGASAKYEIDKIKEVISKNNKNIKLEYSHDFLNHSDLLKFLKQNDVNIFLYDKHETRSLSSTIDYALSIKKPIGISDSHMFRHINWVTPTIMLDNTNIKDIINNGIEPLNKLYEIHSNKNLIEKFEYSINKFLNR
jgi:hypothetical protein